LVDIRDFESFLPDPQPYVEKALALYESAVGEKHGRIIFIAAELGGGKTDLVNALAQALHNARPEPNFVAGSFRGGEYYRCSLDWQRKICLKKAVQAVGESAQLLGLVLGPYGFAASLIGQLLQASASTHEFVNEFNNQPHPGKESANRLRKLLRRVVAEKPVVCVLDDWDEAQRFYWDDMLLSFSREIAQDLPLLLFVTVKLPINLAAPDEDESHLARVIKALTEKGLAEWWQLPKLSQDEVADRLGNAAPGIAAKLHGVTSGNSRWVRELWREWRLNEIVVMNEAQSWIWGPRHEPTINLYDDILRERLGRLLNAQSAMEIEKAREVLACGALEGMRFTADAVALTLGRDRDELIDFLDEMLVQSKDNPDGLLLEENSVNITRSDDTTRALWRYSFVSELHWLALERYGFANAIAGGKSHSERLEKTAALVKALKEAYAREERLAAGPLAHLLRSLGQKAAAQHYQRVSNYSAEREAMRKYALHLMALDKDDWDTTQCALAADFLITVGKAMVGAFSCDETVAVLEEAITLARRSKFNRAEVYALYLCGFTLSVKGDNEAARKTAETCLNLSRRFGNKTGIGQSLLLLAKIDLVEGHQDDARTHATLSFELSQETGNRSGFVVSLSQLAEIDLREDHYADARRKAEQVLEIAQERGTQEGLAGALKLLGTIDSAEGRYDDARSEFTQSLEICKDIGNRINMGCLLHQLAEVDRLEGRYDDARRRATESMAIDLEIGNRGCTALSLGLLAQIDKAQGRLDEARDRATQSFTIYQEISFPGGMAASLNKLAKINYAERHYDDASTQAKQSLAINQEIGSRRGMAASLRILAEIDNAENRSYEALRHATRAWEINQAIGNRQAAATILLLLGDIAFKLQRRREAFDLINLGLLILTEIGDDPQEAINDMADLHVPASYCEEQLVAMNQQILDAYRQDGGKELIGNALAILCKVDHPRTQPN
jgi:tetratricopeptide (TPR) repeat protein